MASQSGAADRARAYLADSDAYPRENEPVIAQSEGRELDLLRDDLAALLRERDDAAAIADPLFRQHEGLLVRLCAVLGLDYTVASEQDVLAALEACKAADSA